MHTLSNSFRKVGHKDSNYARQQLEVKTVGLAALHFSMDAVLTESNFVDCQ